MDRLLASSTCLVVATLFLITPSVGHAQWPVDGRGLCTARSGPLASVSDGSGGAIVTWYDRRNGDYGIYAQHISSTGTVDPDWPVDGRAICTAFGPKGQPQVISDGAGGAIATWWDLRNFSDTGIGVQHILATGAVDPNWPLDGRVVGDDPSQDPSIVADGSGGAIVTWWDYGGGVYNIYAQHILATGAVDPDWPIDGLAVCSAPGEQSFPTLAEDGSGGAIVVWQDYRGGAGYDIYAQHVLSTGATDSGWPTNGRALCVAAGDQKTPIVVSDGAGGTIVTWYDYRSGSTSDVYAQRILNTGMVDPDWPANGRSLCTAAGNQSSSAITADGTGGAIITWADSRSGTRDVYAQHVLSTGTVDSAWPADGRAICMAAGEQNVPTIVADGAGGAVVAWSDNRSCDGIADICAQHVLSNGAVDAAWPSEGLPVCSADGAQSSPRIITDGSGGAIVAWPDARSGAPGIYAQHVSSDGLAGDVYHSDGFPVCRAINEQQRPAAVEDGTGGAIIAWGDLRNANPDIYAQHVLPAGTVDPLWPEDGRALCISPGIQTNPIIVADGVGGAIVAWSDYRNGAYSDIYSQHVLSTGDVDPAWPASGRAVCTAPGEQTSPTVTVDGVGGAIIAWCDNRNGAQSDIYVQHLLSTGESDPTWPVDGRALCSAFGHQSTPTIVPDNAGGAVVAWGDLRNEMNFDVYAHHILSTGEVDPTWPVDGLAVSTAGGHQYFPTMSDDDAGGAIIAWYDYRSGTTSDIYAQHVLATGTLDPVWPADGRALCVASGGQYTPIVVTDGVGGAIVVWYDYRAGNNADIYAHHVLPTGEADSSWPVDGRALCVASGDQQYPISVEDGAGGAIVTWHDYRGGPDSDIYAHHVMSTGEVDPSWPIDGFALSNALGDQEYPAVVRDNAGGAIVAWGDHRSCSADIYAQHVSIAGGVTAVEHGPTREWIRLRSPYPNPTRNSQISIPFELPSNQPVVVKVIDLAGHRVRTLALGREFAAGKQVLTWDGRNDAGEHSPSGIYFVRVRVGPHSETRRVVLLH